MRYPARAANAKMFDITKTSPRVAAPASLSL